jgi:hypothetical protein
MVIGQSILCRHFFPREKVGELSTADALTEIFREYKTYYLSLYLKLTDISDCYFYDVGVRELLRW